VASGFLLGIAVAAKPFLFVFSIFFIRHLFFKNDRKSRVWKAMIFILALITAPLVTTAENSHVSHGRLRSIAAVGGLNFFQGWAKVAEISSTGMKAGGLRYSPAAVDESLWKPFKTKEPWYHQGYFYRLGLESIKMHPSVLVEKIFWFRKFFWKALGPCLKSRPVGFSEIMPIVQSASYMIFLSLGMFGFFLRRPAFSRDIFFLFQLLASFFVFIYVIGLPERRYYLNIEFLIIALFCVLTDRMFLFYKIYKKEICIYGLFIFSFFICLPAAWPHLSRVFP